MKARFSSVGSHDKLVTTGPRALFLSSQEIRAQHATASAIRHLSEREAAFSKSAVLAAALNLQVRGVDPGHVIERIDQLVRQGHLIPGKSERIDGHVDLVTTPQSLRMETAVLERIQAASDQGRIYHDPQIASQRLQEATTALGIERAGMRAIRTRVERDHPYLLKRNVAPASTRDERQKSTKSAGNPS
ncbi:MAG: hypothetical protein IPG54_15030 [Sphingomonadales bacterium]|nr:hypothetical protein [Sphingomonadales bacterium]